MRNVVEKITSVGNRKIILTERGTCFGYNRLVNDMTSIFEMQALGFPGPALPVVFDATHSTQEPGIGGTREHAPILARAGVAAGANGLFTEVHIDPNSSKSDRETIMPIEWLEDLIIQCKEIHKIVWEKK